MAKTTTKMELVSIDKLIPYVNNARTHSTEQVNKLRSSLREFGFINPVIIDKDFGVLAGHGRLRAAREEGITEVPCVLADYLTEAQKKAYILADNRYAEDAGWDEEMLRIEIESLQAESFDVSLTGFDEMEIADLFKEEKNAEEDNFDVDAELKQPCFSKTGDIWHLGRHTVICGDSTDPATYQNLLEGTKVNMVLTDLPYFVAYEGTAGTIQNDNLPDKEAYIFTEKAMRCMHDSLADDGSIYVFHSDSKGLIFRKAFDEVGFYLSGCCIWKKNALVLGRSPYQWQHEPCLYGWKKGGKHQWYSDRKQTTIWEYDRPTSNKLHPTMKPVVLMSYPIKNSTMTNGIVLDPFLGSGSTMIACEETNRVCCGIELDTKFVDVIVKRYIEHQDGNYDDVYVIRDGAHINYHSILEEMDCEVQSGE